MDYVIEIELKNKLADIPPQDYNRCASVIVAHYDYDFRPEVGKYPHMIHDLLVVCDDLDLVDAMELINSFYTKSADDV